MSVPMVPQAGAPMIAKSDLDTKLRRAAGVLEVHPTDFRRRIIPYDERLTEPDRAMLTARLNHLKECMQSDPAVVRAQISLMRVTYRSFSTPEEASIELAIWVNRLSKRPGWAVQETVERFLDGRVQGADNRRGPTLTDYAVDGAEVDEPICPQFRAKAQREAAAIIAGIVSAAKLPNCDVGNRG